MTSHGGGERVKSNLTQDFHESNSPSRRASEEKKVCWKKNVQYQSVGYIFEYSSRYNTYFPEIEFFTILRSSGIFGAKILLKEGEGVQDFLRILIRGKVKIAKIILT